MLFYCCKPYRIQGARFVDVDLGWGEQENVDESNRAGQGHA